MTSRGVFYFYFLEMKTGMSSMISIRLSYVLKCERNIASLSRIFIILFRSTFTCLGERISTGSPHGETNACVIL